MRTLKRFETEAQFEEWKNSPHMRTPYTCLVTETGAVHYDEGSDDDYSVTFVVRDDAENGWHKFVGINMAPCFNVSGETFDYDSTGSHGRDNDSCGARIFRNGEELFPPDIKHYSSYRKGTGFRKTGVYAEGGDVIKIVFDTNYIYHGGFFGTIGPWVKEVIIGDGIKDIRCRAFMSHKIFDKRLVYNDKLKIFLGKNTSYVGKQAFKVPCEKKIFLNTANRKIVSFNNSFDEDIYDVVCDKQHEFIDEI